MTSPLQLNAMATVLNGDGLSTSANLASAVTDETGSGALVFGSTPTISNANLTGTVTGSASYTSVTLTTPNIDRSGFVCSCTAWIV